MNHPRLLLFLALTLTALPSPAKPKARRAAVAVAAPAPDAAWPFVAAQAEPDAAATPPPGGLGIVLGEQSGDVVVQQVVPGGPAQRAGVRAGDVLIATETLPTIHGMKLPDVTPQIRGAPGTVCQLRVRRGAEELAFAVTRVAMRTMFPPPSKEVIAVKPGASLIAVGARRQFAVTWLATQKAVGDQPPLVTAQVATAAPGEPLLPGTGNSVEVRLAPDATPLTIDDWRLDLRQLADGETVAVTGSTLPLIDVGSQPEAWRQPWPEPVMPRAPPKLNAKWRGPIAVRLRAEGGKRPLAGQRIALRILQNKRELETVTALTDGDGRFQIGLDPGPFQIRALVQATPGGGHDAAFAWQLAAEQAGVATADAGEVTLGLTQRAPAPGTVDDWQKDKRVGTHLPALPVKRWLSEAPQHGATLHGQVLLVYVWATWCGPCRMTAPQIAELNVRMAGTGLRIVEAAVDKDEQALEAFHREFLPGAPSVAWLGPDGMETLELSSIPTFIVVDHTGTIRGLRRGGGWGLKALEVWLRQLLAAEKS